MKQEEIEKEADRRFSTVGNEGISNTDSFIKGVEFAQSKMYLETEVKNLFNKYFESQGMGEYQTMDFDVWFELSKKK